MGSRCRFPPWAIGDLTEAFSSLHILQLVSAEGVVFCSFSTSEVAASAVLFGGGAGVDALGSVSANPVWWRLGGGAFTFKADVGAETGAAAEDEAEAEVEAEVEADGAPVGAVEIGTWAGTRAPAEEPSLAATGPAGFAAPPPAASAAAAAARAAAFAALLANSPAVRRRDPSGR
ncbi:hypothetical protein AK812_SmicGene44768 [Symbiodinium microadriaticum]|uniref:Uncharacterized protein n=1 Tax=Symbiodinium microadriaticum TaxID=2951 RepID=A0A1Q9BXX3_SYMMI|nr:hypothetical protein AK812_SmicGene44768 [Symbiodinium microadriaticum]